jgi:hypothetical protein
MQNFFQEYKRREQKLKPTLTGSQNRLQTPSKLKMHSFEENDSLGN